MLTKITPNHVICLFKNKKIWIRNLFGLPLLPDVKVPPRCMGSTFYRMTRRFPDCRTEPEVILTS